MGILEMMENKIEELINPYVDELVVGFHLVEEVLEEDDVQLTYKVMTPTGCYMLKLARNAFTTIEQVEKWSELSREYEMLGYETPSFLKNGDHYAYRWMDFSGLSFVVWCETFVEVARDKGLIDNDSRKFRASLGELIGKVATQTQKFDMYTPTPYCLYDKFYMDDPFDEYMVFMEKTYKLLKGHSKIEQMHLEFVYSTFMRLRMELKEVYKSLPTAVFQSDLRQSNLKLRDKCITGVGSFNLSGREVVLNYLINEGVYEEEQVIHELWLDESYNNEADEKFMWVIRKFSEYYTLSNEEKRCFPLVYKVIRPFKYLFFVGLVRSFMNEDYLEVNCRLKWMIRELERTDLHQMIEEGI